MYNKHHVSQATSFSKNKLEKEFTVCQSTADSSVNLLTCLGRLIYDLCSECSPSARDVQCSALRLNKSFWHLTKNIWGLSVAVRTVIIPSKIYTVLGLLASEGWWEEWQPTPRYSGSISGQRKSWKTPGELGVSKSMECDIFPFSALTLLVGWQEGHLVCKKNWMLVCWWWWFDWSFARLIAPIVQLSPPPPPSFASINTG